MGDTAFGLWNNYGERQHNGENEKKTNKFWRFARLIVSLQRDIDVNGYGRTAEYSIRRNGRRG